MVDTKSQLIATAAFLTVLLPAGFLVAKKVEAHRAVAAAAAAAMPPVNAPAPAVAPPPQPVTPTTSERPGTAAAPAEHRFASRELNATDAEFFAYKFRRPPVYDMAIGGDSRVGVGISPGEMKNYLGDLRIFNFGFRGLCWTPDYLEALHGLLDPASTQKAVVMGISPGGLTSVNRTANGFKEMKRKSRLGQLANKAVPTLVEQGEVPGALRNGIVYIYHEDGWVGALRKSNEKAMDFIKGKYGEAAVDPRIVDYLLATVGEWSSAGIKVYAFRTPTRKDIGSFEDDCVSFDEADFRRRFEANGGIWLEIDNTGLSWRDGHHLDVRSAILFSARLAKAISKAGQADKSHKVPAAQAHR
ncbi:MAG: hypothetical protein JO102_00980 [Elusimicrobia bacterium]|nr:hypothetical protein [Elusimicrobiota bacterium]